MLLAYQTYPTYISQLTFTCSKSAKETRESSDLIKTPKQRK